MLKVAVIGCGAAGSFAAIAAAKNNSCVTVFEKNEKTGKKLFITGKGRANITNDCEVSDFLTHIVRNHKAASSALYNFPPQSLMDFFTSRGTPLKTERGGRVFPCSDKSSDIIKTIDRELQALGVTIKYNCPVINLNAYNGKFFVNNIEFNRVVIATGGLSYPTTGSTGDGYTFARAFLHNIVEPLPALSALITDRRFEAGLSLKNIFLKITDDKKTIFEEFGELLFTHNGISGPIALTASSKINRLLLKKTLSASIDFKPTLSTETLDARLLRELDASKNMAIKNIMPKLLPVALVSDVLKQAGIEFAKQANSITRNERIALSNSLKSFSFKIIGIDGSRAIITSGGIDISEVDTRTMESKLQKGLYFAGEMLDMDAETGGYNLQLAFSTGMLAGQHASVLS